MVIRQQIRQRAQVARDARRVALTRGYRKGELPDIEQLTISDFAEPLRALLCTCDPPVSQHTGPGPVVSHNLRQALTAGRLECTGISDASLDISLHRSYAM